MDWPRPARVGQFAGARLRHSVPRWRKTDHAYPAHRVAGQRPRLGQVLIRMRCLSQDELNQALGSLPPGQRLGEYLVHLRKLSEESVYRALSVQAGIPWVFRRGPDLNHAAARALPLDAVRRWKALPYRIAIGQLHVLTPEVPGEEMTSHLRSLSGLEIRFRLVRPAEFEHAAAEILGRRPAGAVLPLSSKSA